MAPRKKPVAAASSSDDDGERPVANSKKRGRPSQTKKKGRANAGSSDEEENTDYEGDKNKGRAKKGTGKGKKAAGKGKGKQVDSDDDDDDNAAAGSGSGEDDEAPAKKGALSSDERNKLVILLTRQVLLLELNRKPLKREDLSKTVLSKGNAKHFNTLFPLVQKNLRAVLGYELVLLRPKHGVKSGGKSYVVRSTLPASIVARTASLTLPALKQPRGLAADALKAHPIERNVAIFQEDEGAVRDFRKEGVGEYAILGVILGLILVSGKSISDQQLMSYLRRLHLTPTSSITVPLSSRPTTVTLASYLTLLMKQHYLEKAKSVTAVAMQGVGSAATQAAQKAGEGGEIGMEWRWGARSEVEFGEIAIARFMKDVYVGGNKLRGVANNELASDSEEGSAESDEDEAAKRKAAKKNTKANGGTGKELNKSEEKILSEIQKAAGDPLQGLKKAGL